MVGGHMAPLSDKHYHALFMQSPVAMVVLELDGTIIDVNPAGCRLRGRTREDLIGTNSLELVDQRDRVHASTGVATLMQHGVDHLKVERLYDRPDGSHVWAESVIDTVTSDDGTPVYLQAIVTDITERKAAEATRWLVDLMASSRDAVIQIGLDGVVLSWNDGAERIFGYAANEIVGQDGQCLQSPGMREDSIEIFQRILRGERVERRLVRMRKDGTPVTVLSVSTPTHDANGKLVGIATVARDVGEQERADAVFRSLLEAAPDAMVCLDTDGRITLANAASERLFGYLAPRLVGSSIERLLPGAALGLAGALDQHANGMQASALGARRELLGRRADGSEFPAEIAASSVPIEDGNAVIVTIRDGTERHQAAIVASSSEAIVGRAMDGTISSWNAAAERLYGFSALEVIGSNIYELIVPDHLRAEASELHERVLRGLRVEGYETQRLTREGRTIDVSITLSPIKDDEGTTLGISATARDITQAKRYEERLRQSERLDSLGHLAGGVAHDFNNLLTVIMSSAEFLAEDVEGDALRDVEAITAAGERAALLTRQLLTFARQDAATPQSVSMNAIVGEVEALLVRTLGEQVVVSTHLADEVWPVLADPGQVEQVLINLAVNGRDAMPGGGSLSIDTANLEVDAEYAATYPNLVPGYYVRLRVTDTGTGMPQEVAQHAFEPFFTTKGAGKGTGLGLATVHGIVSQAGGGAHIYSEVGTGTTITTLWPAGDGEPVAAGTDTQDEVAGGNETILVVDDQLEVREIAQRILRDRGYQVLVAESGGAALALAAAHDGKINLVVTDVVMPGLSGAQLVAELHAARPEAKAVYMSGYAGDFLQLRDRAQAVLLEKPFTGHQLLSQVRRALDA